MVYTYTSYCIHDIKLPSQHQTYLYYIKCNALTTESDVIFAIFFYKKKGFFWMPGFDAYSGRQTIRISGKQSVSPFLTHF